MTWTIQGDGELPIYNGNKTITGTLTVGGQAGFADGTVAAPGIAFTSDLDTGLYRIGANNIGVAANGAKILDIATTGLSVTGTLTPSGVILAADGDAGTPSISFAADTDTGMFRRGANLFGFSTGGTSRMVLGSGGAEVQAAGGYYWSSTTDPSATPDLGLLRDAANVLALKNSTAGQEARIYGTTTGPKYASLKHDGTDATLDTAASSGKLILGGNASDIQWNKALVATGGGATALMVAVIGGSGPATAQQNSWVRLLDSTGAAVWVPAWK